jgi:hypothetical protein
LTEHVARLEIPYVWMEGEFKSWDQMNLYTQIV